MHADSTNHIQAMEFLFLFHACKLTNHRPDQSVSLSEVGRAAALSQELSEQLCASLREARLIRYSSLLGDISVTRFGVSEVVTTKTCPHSGSNYFPAVRAMGLRFSRGHHLFDELELRQITCGPDRQESISNLTGESAINSANKTIVAATAFQLADDGASRVLADNSTGATASQTRQEIIRELENLLKELDEMPTAQPECLIKRSAFNAFTGSNDAFADFASEVTTESCSELSTDTDPVFPVENTQKNSAGTTVKRPANYASSAPSLLMNPQWRQQRELRRAEYADINSQQQQLLPLESGQDDCADEGLHPDINTGVNHLNAMMDRWCLHSKSGKKRADNTGLFISELETINQSLFNFT